MDMRTLTNLFNDAIENEVAYVAVAIQIESNPSIEIIINSTKSLKEKLAYYKHSYNDDLTHKSPAPIKIVGAMATNQFGEIESYFYKV